MRVGLATIQRGRAPHLARQALGVAEQTRAPDDWVVLSMDPAPAAAPASARTIAMPVQDGVPLPLAAARNAAIRALGDVDLAILLDVDCVPAPRMVERYARAAREHDDLLAGPVGHLPPGCPTGPRVLDAHRGAAVVRGGRPVPADGTTQEEPRHELFWSLSFALAPATHERIGGFDEGYAGYGGEDTDYALRARRAGVGLRWVGGAWAHHQHHPVSSPPREHLHDIVRNARRFRERWGVWPMEGWLRAFAAEGLIAWDPSGDDLEATASAPARAAATRG